MEEVIDRLVQEVSTLATTDSSSGGIADIIALTGVKWDDPGVVSIDEYPYAYIAPVMTEPKSETAGLAGGDVVSHYINVVIVIDQSDYFDPLVDNLAGSRELVAASGKLRTWLRRLGKRRLDGLARGLVVQSTNYVPDMRGDAFVRSAVTTLVVDKQYQHSE